MQDDFEVGGQAVAIRGTHRGNPALLVLPGPGLATRRHAGFFAPWEDAFTLIHWDQPASAPLTFDSLAGGGEAAAETLADAGPPPWSDLRMELAKSLYANAPTPAEAPEWGAFIAAGDPAHDGRAAAFGAYMAIRDELAAFDAETLGLDYQV